MSDHETPREYDLLSMQQIADLLGVSHHTVPQWRKRDHIKFPPPDVQAPQPRSTPMWYWGTVEKWAEVHRPKLLPKEG